MAIFRCGLISVLALSAAAFAGCGAPGNANVPKTAARPAENPNAARTNAEELAVLVRLPYETEDIVWKEIPNKKRVIAVLRFSTANANRIVAEAGGTPTKAVVPVESWFPEELVAQSEMSGDNTVKGIGYPATNFFQEPYKSGSLIRVDGSDYFILDLAAN